MLASIKMPRSGMTIVELIIALTVVGMLLIPSLTIMLSFYIGTIKNNVQAQLAVESQNVLRSVVEELRVSSGVRDSNAVFDTNAPGSGWTTSEASLVLIVATPVIDNSNEYVISSVTGEPYQNEIVYFASDGVLYKRYLADTTAPGNRFKTSCPAAFASASCPADVVLSDHFKDMAFVFYDQDNTLTTTLAEARSIQLTVQMEQRTLGQTIAFENNIRITLRNTL